MTSKNRNTVFYASGHILVPVLIALVAASLVFGLAWNLLASRSGQSTARENTSQPSQSDVSQGSRQNVVNTSQPSQPDVSRGSRQDVVNTSLYSLTLNYQSGFIPKPVAQGGSLARFAKGLLLIDGDGRFYYIDTPSAATDTVARALSYRAPLNGAELDAADIPGLRRDFFGVLDLGVFEIDGEPRVFVSHHYWKPAERCFVIRVSQLNLSAETLFADESDDDWSRVFETSPCLPVKELGHVFMGQESGGRLALLDANTLLMTVGDLQFDGTLAEEMYAQDPAASYGKSLLIDLASGASEVFTMGHRNPQGLYVAPDGRIWSTEHGPKGGDELNLLQAGNNYGWPIVTYGTQYRSNTWPRNPSQGRHDGYVKSVFAWVPSIGIANVIGVEKDLFPAWQGDLLIASLRDMTLYRVRVDGQHVSLVEPIPLGVRARDLVEADDGRIYIWAGQQTLITVGLADASNDSKLAFRVECAGCHSTRADQLYAIGPQINVAFEAPVAATEYPYSDALIALGGNWDAERLDAFLENPAAFAPGTSMQTGGVPDPERRLAIIEHMKWLKSR